MKTSITAVVIASLFLFGCTQPAGQPIVSPANTAAPFATATSTPYATSQPTYSAPTAAPTYYAPPGAQVDFTIESVRTDWVSGNGYGTVYGPQITFRNNGAAIQPLFDVFLYRVDGERILKSARTIRCTECNSVSFGNSYRGELAMVENGNLLTNEGDYVVVVVLKNVPPETNNAYQTREFPFKLPPA